MNLRALPFLRLLLPFAAGIFFGETYGILPSPLLNGCALLLFAALLFAAFRSTIYRYRWVFGVLLTVFLFLAGIALVAGRPDLRDERHFSRQSPGARFFVGRLYEATGKGARVKAPLRIEAAGAHPDSLWPCTGNVLLFLELDSLPLALHYGDRVAFKAVVRPCERPKNPHAFDYGRYLHFQNIHYQAFVRTDSLWRLSEGHGSALWRAAYACRDRLLERLRAHFPGQGEYAVAAALLVGYKDDLPEELQAAYAETGSMHALAVSGTHVGMLYAGLMLMLQRLPVRGRAGRFGQHALILTAIWAFAFLTGATASVLRATVMFSVYLVGKTLYRAASVWNILAASAFGLLAFNPCFLLDAGFQLSYAAVAGMVFFYPRLYKHAPVLPHWADGGLKILLIGVAAQLGTLPLTLYYFHQFPVYFWLAGWVVVVGGAVFLWGGAALVILDAAAPAPAAWLGVALHGMVWGMNRLIVMIQGLPGSVVSGIWLPAWAAALLYVALLCVAAAWARRSGRWLLAALALLAVLGAARLARAVERRQQRALVVYHVHKTGLIDFIDGERAVCLADSGLTARQLRFAAQSNRWARGVRAVTDTSGSWAYRPPLLYAGGRLVARITPDIAGNARADPVVPVDALLLSRNARGSVAGWLARFPAPVVVFDVSSSLRCTERWKAECRRLGIPFHDVRTQGAWVLEISSFTPK